MVDSKEASEAQPLFYIIEHFEEELSDWTLSEYVHMILILSKLYKKKEESSKFASSLILTNFNFVSREAQGKLKEDDLNSLANTKRLEEVRKVLVGRCLVTELSFEKLTSTGEDVSSLVHDDT